MADEAERRPPSADGSRWLLERYLTLVVEHARLMAVLESSIATLRTLDVGIRTRAAMDRLAALGVLHYPA